MQNTIISRIADLAEIGVRYGVAMAVIFNITGPIVLAAAFLARPNEWAYSQRFLIIAKVTIMLAAIVLGIVGVWVAATIASKPSKRISALFFTMLGVIPYFVVWDAFSRKMADITGTGLSWPWVCLCLLLGGLLVIAYFSDKKPAQA